MAFETVLTPTLAQIHREHVLRRQRMAGIFQKEEVSEPHVPAPPLFHSCPIDPAKTFETYVVCKANENAHAASLHVATVAATNPLAFNPLFIHSAPWMGKSHLLHAITAEARANERNAVYVTSHYFVGEIAGIVRDMREAEIIAGIERIDMLLVDDINLIVSGSGPAQFGRLLRIFAAAGKQVVVSSDRRPEDINLGKNCRKALAAGQLADIGSIEVESRVEIVRSKIAGSRFENPQFDLPDAAVLKVAQCLMHGRDIDAVVKRLLARSLITDEPVTEEIVQDEVRDYVLGRTYKKPRIDDVQRAVARHYRMSIATLKSRSKKGSIAKARFIAMYLSRVVSQKSTPEIGRRFANRDHTTVLNAITRVREWMSGDAAFAEEIRTLWAEIEGRA